MLSRLVYFCCFLFNTISSTFNSVYLCFVVDAIVFQEDGRLNMVLPGSLLPYKKEICEIFRVEKAKFMFNPRFQKAFASTDIQPVFINRPNLKKLIVRTKLV